MDEELNDTIKSAYPENTVDIKNEIINRNLTLKTTLNERGLKKSGENSSERTVCSNLQNYLLKNQILLN